MIFGHYLMVRPWQPNFDPNQSSPESLLVWVRIPCLPIEYFDSNFLMRLGARIGRPIKVDNAVSVVSRGLYARVCVDVNLQKPIVSKFMLRRRVRKIEYEGIHLVCFGCGMYVHGKEGCPLKEKISMKLSKRISPTKGSKNKTKKP